MTTRAAARVRCRIRVTGIVQGVGYRPFVFALAARLGIGGHVGNDAQGVFAEAEGPADVVECFLAALRAEAPPLALVDEVHAEIVAVTGQTDFAIVASRAASSAAALVTPDTGTCADCLREIADPADRRYRYPFTNCTNCGPRFTIARTVPYDRVNTTMAGFALCDRCATEYADPGDRRFHAQPVCCPSCGPTVRLLSRDGRRLPGDPITETARLVTAGAVVAIKGLGGYHLAADATDAAAVTALRSRKHREDKPFAVMVPDLDTARQLCAVDQQAEHVLMDRRRPIVLLPRRADGGLAAAVAPGNRDLGLMLPYTPLHSLLSAALRRPFVLTSGNVSDEPIAFADSDARTRLAGIADAFLVHDRPIHVRVDDSVVRVVRGAPTLLRRSRGYVPAPLTLPHPAARPILACGAELKSTFCLARGRRAFVSQHIGDLKNAETLRAYVEGVAHFRGLFDIAAEVVAHDLHPDYLSTKYAQSLPDVELVGVQHHHAHVAACLADNGVCGPVIGIACDGTGYGPDGALWGGEILIADLAGYERAAHLTEIALPGGVTAIRQPWRTAVGYLTVLGADDPGDLDLFRRHAGQWPAVAALARSPLSIRTTSAGRLFDAVAALVGIRDTVNYEGQAAIELEQRVDLAERGAYPMRSADGVLHAEDLVAAVLEDVRTQADPGVIASRFHQGLSVGLAAAVGQVRDRTGLATVALSGGVFQNVVLTTDLAERLSRDGFTVLLHRQVPPNDGGISFGQAAAAAACEN